MHLICVTFLFLSLSASLTLSGDEQLCVSKIMQKIKIEVNEQGTKAAAASGKA